MKRGITGFYINQKTGDEVVSSFVPNLLPPDPKVEWLPEIAKIHEKAIVAVGRLDGVLPMLPDSALFLYSYIRKEALLSSQIEGTQSSLTDLFAFEAGETLQHEFDDIAEVSNYVAAMEHGLKRIRGGFPLSNRLVCEIHGILLSSGRGEGKQPGEFRTTQNWIGGARPGNAKFVPPPPEQVGDSMSGLEKFIHNDPQWTSVLMKAALAHVQFETIHPFCDGNGRVGRLLITLILCSEGLLREPLLYLSLYLKENRQNYYDLLQRVRMEGVWEEWLEFFFAGVEKTANEAAATAHNLLQIFDVDTKKIQSLGRQGSAALQIHHFFQRYPLRTGNQIAEQLKLSMPTINKGLKKLVDLEILREVSGRKRNRLFVYSSYLERLQEGTAPIRR